MKVKFKLTDFINNDIETLTSVHIFFFFSLQVCLFRIDMKALGLIGGSIVLIVYAMNVACV